MEKEKEEGKNNKRKDFFAFDYLKKIRELAQQKRAKDKKKQNIQCLIVVLISFLLFLYFLNLNIWLVPKVILITILLFITGEILTGLKELDGSFGIIFFKDKRFLDWIDKTAKKYSEVFVFLADIGFILGYGLLGSYLIERKPGKWIRVIIGLFVLVFLILFIMPFTYTAIAGSMNNSDIVSASNYLKEKKIFDFNFELNLFENKFYIDFRLIFFLITVIFGLGGAVFSSIILYSGVVLYGFAIKIVELVLVIFGNTQIKQSILPPPGGTILLPGSNLPLIEGLIAFVLILIVHEFFHGFLARVYGIKLNSTGIVLFGIIPIGAFVEPDEEELSKIKKEKQNRVLIAGSASNFYFAILFFVLMIIILILTTTVRLDGYVAKLTNGNEFIVYKVNQVEVDKINLTNMTFFPNQKVILQTSKGDIIQESDGDGKVNFKIERYYKNAYLFKYKYKEGFWWIEFILDVLKLSFSLNIIVGSINLIFIPFFDGHRILQNALENKKLFDFIVFLSTAAFLINLIPWIFK
ncbi:MAG: site-2 protease family protein [Candidatus Anstonellaceae archaeon]